MYLPTDLPYTLRKIFFVKNVSQRPQTFPNLVQLELLQHAGSSGSRGLLSASGSNVGLKGLVSVRKKSFNVPPSPSSSGTLQLNISNSKQIIFSCLEVIGNWTDVERNNNNSDNVNNGSNVSLQQLIVVHLVALRRGNAGIGRTASQPASGGGRCGLSRPFRSSLPLVQLTLSSWRISLTTNAISSLFNVIANQQDIDSGTAAVVIVNVQQPKWNRQSLHSLSLQLIQFAFGGINSLASSINGIATWGVRKSPLAVLSGPGGWRQQLRQWNGCGRRGCSCCERE